MDMDEKYLGSFFEESNLYVAVISPYKTLVRVNKTLLDFAMVKEEEILGNAYFELPWWNHSTDLQNKLLFAMEKAFLGESARFVATYINRMNELFEIDFVLKPITEDDEIVCVLAMGYNITDFIHTQKALTTREKEIKAFFDNSNDGYFFYMLPERVAIIELSDEFIQEAVSNHQLRTINTRLKEILGRSDLNNDNLIENLGFQSSEIVSVWRRLLTEGRIQITKAVLHPETREFVYLDITIVRILEEDGKYSGSFGIVRDMTIETRYMNKLSFFANKDPLTGLNNRRRFYELAYDFFQNMRERGSSAVISMLDIDHFKKVNDIHGHNVGDEVLKRIASIMMENFPDDGIVARMGGEEFVIVLHGDWETVLAQLERVRLCVEGTSFPSEKGEFKITVSMGSSILDERIADLDLALINADKALYESKSAGRNRITLFIEEIHGQAAYDKITGVLTEKSMLFRLGKSLTIVKSQAIHFLCYISISALLRSFLLKRWIGIYLCWRCVSPEWFESPTW
jgi:diguanylate cyclase (GGDEF)-like protein